jgi:hypothetical protein
MNIYIRAICSSLLLLLISFCAAGQNPGAVGVLTGRVVNTVYATFDPANSGANWTLSSGNLVATNTNTIAHTTRATISHSTGKYYFEFIWNTAFTGCATTTLVVAGIVNSSWGVSGTTLMGVDAGGNSYAWSGYGLGNFYFQNVTLISSYGSCYCNSGYLTTNMCAIDFTAGKIWYGQSGTWFAGGDPATGANPANAGHLFSGTWWPAFFGYNQQVVSANFGASAFTYTVPAGFNAGYF